VLLLGLTDCDAGVLEEDDVDELPTVGERSTVVEVILSVTLGMEERLELVSVEAVETA
jgi:hypothetical protein